MKTKVNVFSEEFEKLSKLTEEQTITIRTILSVLAGRGTALLLIIISIPFCLPIQIPGVSTPFGLLITFLGLRIAFGHRVWIPEFVLKQKVSPSLLKKILHTATKMAHKFDSFFYARLTFLVKDSYFHIAHGITIAFLGILLALPIPIPMTNMLAAAPLILFGLGLLEDDGLMILLAYLFTLICVAYYLTIILLGKNGFDYLWNLF